MITEDYCSYEVSKLLDEKGFNEECDNFYSIPTKDLFIPTHQMALKWLRKKGIFIEIGIFGKTDVTYSFNISVLNEGEIYPPLDKETQFFKNFEEAVEAALKYSLENLI